MTYLSGKTVYLCGPLHAEKDDGVGWRDAITPRLQAYNIIVDDPCKKTANGVGEVGDDKNRFKKLVKEKKFLEAKEAFWPIVRKDLRSVDKADFIIFNYIASSPTIGTWHEIINAQYQKKPILMKYDESQLDHFNPWVLTFVKATWCFATWDELFQELDKVNNRQFDSSHWTL
jgi:hypothetical protein